jgi:hypothetical protein
VLSKADLKRGKREKEFRLFLPFFLHPAQVVLKILKIKKNYFAYDKTCSLAFVVLWRFGKKILLKNNFCFTSQRLSIPILLRIAEILFFLSSSRALQRQIVANYPEYILVRLFQ